MVLEAAEVRVFDVVGERFGGGLWVSWLWFWMVQFVLVGTAEVEDGSSEGGFGSDT